ncbi:unnamed protein product [Cylicocyclus nassatus]|uniref:Uncharacterized protein n=1 Tax=Cylicocyclus nassatus TaxID=53992 RepID=A0AA36MH86_CYLNA|nr:unnamed protein product [Cylicocyclus nassatus]
MSSKNYCYHAGDTSARSGEPSKLQTTTYQSWIQYSSATTGNFITCSVPDFVKCGRARNLSRYFYKGHMDSNEALQSYKQPSVSSGRQSDMYKTTQSNVVEWSSHHLESRVRPQSEEQPTCSQRQPNESVHGPLEEIEEERQRKKAEQMAFNRRNEPEDKRKKRLAAQAERSRLRRMKETEERRLERLANDTERRKLRRSTETEEQRSLRLRSLADVRRKQRAQNNNLLKQHHSSQEEFGANSREVLEENVMGNPSDVARNDAFVAFSTQEATPEADPLQHSGTRDAFSGQRSMINFKDLISQRLNTSEDEFQHNASVPYLDESASRPLPSTSAYVPLKDLTIQPLHDEYVLLTPDPALRVVHFNGAIENNLNALPPQSLPPFTLMWNITQIFHSLSYQAHPRSCLRPS